MISTLRTSGSGLDLGPMASEDVHVIDGNINSKHARSGELARMMEMGAGNYEVLYTDFDGRPKKIALFMGDDHVKLLETSGFRVIAGFEKKGGKNTFKIICLGTSQMATLELAN